MSGEIGVGNGTLFREPKSLDDAELRRDTLMDEIGQIEVQLSDRNRINPDTGNRLSDHEYHSWRVRAMGARQFKTSELRSLRRWIRNYDVLARALEANVDPNDQNSLIFAARNVLLEMKKDVDFDESEEAVLAALDLYCRTRIVVPTSGASGQAQS